MALFIPNFISYPLLTVYCHNRYVYCMKDYSERSRKFNVSSPTTGLKATAYRVSPPGYPGGIKVDFFPKTNTFPDRRKEVIPWRYFALRKPVTTR